MGRRSVIVRLICTVALLAVLGPGCAAVPELTAEDEATLSARALAEICATKCSGLTTYVRDEIFSTDAIVGEERAMSPEMMSVIEDKLVGVQFVNREQVHALVIDGVLVDRDAILLFVGPVIPLAANVVGVEVGAHTAQDGAWGGTQQFQWTGQAWAPADPEETGVTTVTWVS